MLLGEAALTASYGCGGQERAWLANFKVSLGEAFHCSDYIIEFLTLGRQGLVFCLVWYFRQNIWGCIGGLTIYFKCLFVYSTCLFGHHFPRYRHI